MLHDGSSICKTTRIKMINAQDRDDVPLVSGYCGDPNSFFDEHVDDATHSLNIEQLLVPFIDRRRSDFCRKILTICLFFSALLGDGGKVHYFRKVNRNLGDSIQEISTPENQTVSQSLTKPHSNASILCMVNCEECSKPETTQSNKCDCNKI